MLFPPILLFSSYLNLSNYKTDAAGITAAWSGLYALLAIRRSQVSASLRLFLLYPINVIVFRASRTSSL
jgi:hypothetical protein